MAIALRIIIILVCLYTLYIFGRKINKVRINKQKLRTFTLLLPKRCVLLIRNNKSGPYCRGYLIQDNSPILGSSEILLNGYDINPYHPIIDERTLKKTIKIPHELILDGLVDVKYVDDITRIIGSMEKETTINERKNKKGSR